MGALEIGQKEGQVKKGVEGNKGAGGRGSEGAGEERSRIGMDRRVVGKDESEELGGQDDISWLAALGVWGREIDQARVEELFGGGDGVSPGMGRSIAAPGAVGADGAEGASEVVQSHAAVVSSQAVEGCLLFGWEGIEYSLDSPFGQSLSQLSH